MAQAQGGNQQINKSMDLPLHSRHHYGLPYLAIGVVLAVAAIVYTSRAGAPTLSGGGPQNNQVAVPVDAFIDVNASETLNAGTVNTTNVRLETCTGATDASSCASPSGINLCDSVTLNAGQNIVCNLASMTRLSIDTTYKFTVTTGVQSATNDPLAANFTRIFRTGAFDPGATGGITTSPYVQDTIPRSGSNNVAINVKPVFIFSQGPEGNMLADGSTNAINKAGNITLKKMVNFVPTTEVCTGGACTLTWNSSGRFLVVVPSANLDANSEYQFCVAATVQNTQGQAFPGGGSPCYGFTTGSTSDTTGPALRTDGPTIPADGATGVSRFVAPIEASFTEEMDPSTVTTANASLYIDTNANGVKNDGETVLGGSDLSVTADNPRRTVVFGLKAALTATTRYCFDIGAGLKDLVGNAASAVQNKCFTTGSDSDSTAPTVLFADADTFGVVVKFSEPVNQTDAVNPANYALECFAAGGSTGAQTNLSGKPFLYNAAFNEVDIDELGLTPGQQCKITVTGVRDIAGNTIVNNGTTNVAQVITMDTATSGGFLGTGGTQDFATGTNFANFWENPQRCEPQTRVTNKATRVSCEFQAPAALPVGSTFVLTFPSGFTLSTGAGATRVIPSAESWDNKDINGPAANTVTASASVSGSIVTVTTAGGALGNGNHIRFELDRVTTPTTPSDDLRISIVVKDANGVKQGQTIQPAPFNIAQAGAFSISGTVCKGSTQGGACNVPTDTAIANLSVFCDQMGGFGAGGGMSGHQETTTDASGDWTVSGLSNGRYGCGVGMDPTALGNVGGGSEWRDVDINGASVSSVDFKFKDMDTASDVQSLTANITSSASLNGKEVDVFCHAGMSDYQFSKPIMQVVTLNASGAGTATVKLQEGKTYECGVGPHMDFSNFTGGGPPPVPDFDFMPPAPQRVSIPVGSAPSAITFALAVADNTISGTVVDGSNNGIANVYVDAFPKGCFDTDGSFKACNGGFAQSKFDGTFTLKVSPGTYEVSAFMPGAPPADRQVITVTNANVTGVTIKIAKSSVTIAGQVLDEAGGELKYAGVDAEKVATGGTCSSFTPAGGFAFSPTDSNGNYTLYVSNGTWNVRAHAPSYGEVGCITVVVSSGTSATGKNIQATAANFATISGTCLSGSFVGAFGPNGGNHGECNNGAYSLKVKAGANYTVECFAHGKGPCGRQTGVDTTSADQTVNFSTSISTGTVAVTITGITDAFVDVRDSSGFGAGTGQNNNGVYSINLQAGSYTVRGGSPKYGDLCSNQSVTVTAGQTSAITCTPPTNLRTVAGRVTDGTDNLAGATITMTDSTGKLFNSTSANQSGASNNLSMTNVPDGTYTLRASKKGYESASTTATVSGGNLTLSSPVALTQATGASGDTVTVTVRDENDVAYTSATGRVVATTGSGASAKTVVGEVVKTTGTVDLDLTNGTWTLTAYGDNGKKSGTSTVTVASGTADASPTMDLDNTISGFTALKDTQTFALKSGGLIKGENIPGLEVNIPSSTFSTTDTSTATMTMKKDPTIVIDPGADQNFVGSSGFEITPTDANGKETDIDSGSVTLKIPYTDADVAAAGVDESKLVVGTLDANGEWETFSTTIDTVNNILTVEVTHFSPFGILGGVRSAAAAGSGVDTTAPAIPGAIELASDGASVTVTWSDPSDSDFSDVQVLRNNGGSTPVSGSPIAVVDKGVKKHVDSAVEAGKTYIYQLRSRDSAGNGRLSSEYTIKVEAAAATATPTAPPAETLPVVTTPAPTAVTLSAGDLVRTAKSPAVYFVDSAGGLHLFRSESIYKSWYANFNAVRTVPESALLDKTVGKDVSYHPGVRMVKMAGDTKVYAVVRGRTLRWVKTEALAKYFYGDMWHKRVDTVSADHFNSYTLGAAIAKAEDFDPGGEIARRLTPGDEF